MFNKRANNNNNVNPNVNPFMENMNMNNLYPNYDIDRLIYEIKENRRRINNLAKRIVRLENYLRIRDTSDYIVFDEDKNDSFESFYK